MTFIIRGRSKCEGCLNKQVNLNLCKFVTINFFFAARSNEGYSWQNKHLQFSNKLSMVLAKRVHNKEEKKIEKGHFYMVPKVCP